jgi:predicted DsbA family dithiol-disulfide isomerase
VRWTAFPLHPDTPDEGLGLDVLFAGRGIDLTKLLDRLQRTAGDLGLPFGDRRMTFNSRRAQELGKWAEGEGRGDAFHPAVFHAYFARGENIADTEVLRRVAERCGLDGKTALGVLHDRRFALEVDGDWRRSAELGVTAVPTFRLGRETAVGARSYPELLGWVSRHLPPGAPRQ